jgi:hypothetical protein
MKSFFTLLIIILNSALGYCQAAEFSIKESVHKFPKSKEGVLLQYSFEFTNTGTIPLIIESYSVVCSCTKVILPNEPVLPGKSGLIKMVFDTEGKYYLQDRTILLQMNTKKKIQKIRFKVFVIPKDE